MSPIRYLEDEPVVARVVKSMLEALGYDVQHEPCASNFCQAITGSINPGDRYLLDQVNNAPTNERGISGGDIALKLLEMDPDARIVIGTGQEVDELPLEIQAAIETGRIGYLKKPFGLVQLGGMYS